MSQDHAIALQPGDRVRLHLKKKQKKPLFPTYQFSHFNASVGSEVPCLNTTMRLADEDVYERDKSQGREPQSGGQLNWAGYGSYAVTLIPGTPA